MASGTTDVLFKAELDATGAIVSLQKLEDQARQAGGGAGEAASGFGKFTDALKTVGEIVAGYEVFNLLKEGFTKAVEASAALEQAQTRVATVLKATGDVSGLTSADVDKMAEHLQELTGTSKAATENAAAMLMTFTNISGQVFPETMNSAADLAAVMGTDLNSSVTLLGRVLDDPIKNLGLLRRAHIDLSPAQKQTIQDLAQSGDLLGAQAALLDVVKSKVGGAAEALGQTFSGQLKILGANIEDLLIDFGQLITGSDTTVGALQKINSAIGGLAAAFKDTSIMKDFFSNISILGTTLGGALTPVTVYANTTDLTAKSIAVLIKQTQARIDALKQEKAALTDEQPVLDQNGVVINDTRAKQKDLTDQISATQKQLDTYKKGLQDKQTAEKGAQDATAAHKAAQDALNKSLADQALEDSTKKLGAWLDQLDPTRVATRDYQQAVTDLNEGLRLGSINQDDYNRLLADAKEKLDDATTGHAQLFSWLKQTLDTMDPLRQGTTDYNTAVTNLTNGVNAGMIDQDEFNKALDAASDKFASAAGEGSVFTGKLNDLLNQLDPGRVAAEDYANKVGLLDKALSEGRLSPEQYSADIKDLNAKMGDGLGTLSSYTNATTTLSAAAMGTSPNIKDLRDKFEALKAQLDPASASQTAYTNQQALLNAAVDSGAISVDDYVKYWNLAQQAFDSSNTSAVALAGTITKDLAKAFDDAMSGDFGKAWESMWKDLTKVASSTLSEGLFGGAGPLSSDKNFKGILQGGWGDMSTTQQWQFGLGTAGGLISGYGSQTNNQGMSALGGAMSGASAGMEFGWVGAIVGALVGGVMGYFSSSGAKNYSYDIYGGLGGSNVNFGFGGPTTSEMQDESRQVTQALQQNVEDFRSVLKDMGQAFNTIPDVVLHITGKTEDAGHVLQDVLNNQIPRVVLSAYTPMLQAGLQAMGVSADRANQVLGAFNTEEFSKAMSDLQSFVQVLSGLTDLSKNLAMTPDELRSKVTETLRAQYEETFTNVMTQVDALTSSIGDLFSDEQVKNAQDLLSIAQNEYQAGVQYFQQLEQIGQSIDKSFTATFAGFQEQQAKEQGPSSLASFYEGQLEDLKRQLDQATSAEQVQSITQQMLQYGQSLFNLNMNPDSSGTPDYQYRNYVQQLLQQAQAEADADIKKWQQEVADNNQALNDQIKAMTTALESAVTAGQNLGDQSNDTGNDLGGLGDKAKDATDKLNDFAAAAASATGTLQSLADLAAKMGGSIVITVDLPPGAAGAVTSGDPSLVKIQTRASGGGLNVGVPS